MDRAPIEVHRILRREFPRCQVEKGQRRNLTAAMADVVHQVIRSRGYTVRCPPVLDPRFRQAGIYL